MAREHLERRERWQRGADTRFTSPEDIFYAIMRMHLKGTPMRVIPEPSALKQIYRTQADGGAQGVVPDFSVINDNTGRAVFVEIKRQRAAGNAHERACKYMMPGIVKEMRRIARQPDRVIPFWWIFTDEIASDDRYSREIQFWFRGYEGNLLLWTDNEDSRQLVEHYEANIRPMLED